MVGESRNVVRVRSTAVLKHSIHCNMWSLPRECKKGRTLGRVTAQTYHCNKKFARMHTHFGAIRRIDTSIVTSIFFFYCRVLHILNEVNDLFD